MPGAGHTFHLRLFLKLGSQENGPVTTCRPLTHARGGGAAGEEGGREGLFPLPSRQLLVPGSHTDTSCTSRFQGNSSPLDRTRPLNTSRALWAECKPDRAGDSEVAILSPVCARSPLPGSGGQVAPLQEGRGGRGSLAWAAGTESFLKEVGTPWST